MFLEKCIQYIQYIQQLTTVTTIYNSPHCFSVVVVPCCSSCTHLYRHAGTHETHLCQGKNGIDGVIGTLLSIVLNVPHNLIYRGSEMLNVLLRSGIEG